VCAKHRAHGSVAESGVVLMPFLRPGWPGPGQQQKSFQPWSLGVYHKAGIPMHLRFH
jgi:hypothetical protein